jgi:acetyl esterase/lipase
MGSAMRRYTSSGLLAVALILALLAAFIYVPAPHVFLLPLAVGAPEVSPLLAAVSALVCVAALALVRASRVARYAALVAGIAAVMSASPLLRTWSTIARFDEAMTTALGPSAPGFRPSGIRFRVRPSPFSVGDFVRGYREDAAVHVDRLQIPNAAKTPAGLVVYRLRERRHGPVIVQIHGGSWQRGAPEDDGAVARVLASRGYVVFAIDYRHAPTARWPAQIDDVRAALTWVREHAAHHGGDASQIVLLGRSAGAHLALLAAYAERTLDIRGVVAWYGPVDLANGWRNPPSPDPLHVRAILETLIGGTPAERPDAYRAASPLTHVSQTSPATLLLYGTRDHIVEARFGRALHARLRAAGATSILLELPWAEHAFDLIPAGLSGQLALYYTEEFLAAVCAGIS